MQERPVKRNASPSTPLAFAATSRRLPDQNGSIKSIENRTWSLEVPPPKGMQLYGRLVVHSSSALHDAPSGFVAAQRPVSWLQ